MARRSAARILWVGLVAVVLILVLFPNTVTNLFQQQNVLGLDITVQYADGREEKYSSPTLSILNLKTQQVFDVKSQWAVNSYTITPWIIVSYSGIASSWSVSGDVKVKLILTGLEPVDLGVKKTVALTDSSTSPPASGSKRYLNSITVVNNEIESWATADGTYQIQITVSPTVTMKDAASGAPVSKSATGQAIIDVKVSRQPVLSITGLQVGLETKSFLAGGL